jgi:hypothetical protein
MYRVRNTLFALAVLSGLAVLAYAAPAPPKPKPEPRVVQQQGRGDEGTLAYATTERGDRVPDFSYAGYAGGDTTIPNVPVRVVVSPKDGDQTARIQAAIDYVASLAPDEHGVRGAVLLQSGKFEINGGLKIAASGVVLRGSGAGEGGTVLFAAGHDRRTLITIVGKDDQKLGESVAVADKYVPVNATKLKLASAGKLKIGDTVVIHRPSTDAWIKALGMENLGGERHGFSWKAGTRDLAWDRVVTHVDGDTITLDAPITTALDATYGGGTVAAYTWPGRITHVGVENLRCESAFDAANAKDEAHSWFAVTMENARDAWVRQVTFAHFAGSAVAAWESTSRITVEDCKSLAPVSEIGGQRRHAFYAGGQQTLVQRCFSERGRHDFAVGFCAAGPNAFVQCESSESLDDSGAIDSWASGVLFDNVRLDGNAISLADRRYNAQGAGWSAANSMLWQCNASLLRCPSPPTATNWAVGCWGTFDGNGVWQNCNESVRPVSLYYAQLADRIGRSKADARAQIMQIPSDASSSPTAEDAAKLVKMAREPAPTMSKWVDGAAKRNPIPVDAAGAASIDDRRRPPAATTKQPPPADRAVVAAGGSPRALSVQNGWLVVGDQLLVGGRQDVAWWRGGIRPSDLDKPQPCLTRFVPGRTGPGLTDDLDQLTDDMRAGGKVLLQHNYGLWYDRRRDDHERVRRMTGDAWPPFYELPFKRTGGDALGWDGMSKYDLTKYNPWYWDRLDQFAKLAERKGLVLLHNNYFQHNIIEAGAHYVDFPWRTANNVNDTGFPEPPPFAGDKRVFLAEQFYDVSQPTRRALHRAYIRKCLDSFVDDPNVIQLTGEEFTGPLHFVQFWLDTIGEWQRDTGKRETIGLSATKDVQDAILADAERSKLVSVIEMKYWWYTDGGGAYDPPGGQSLSPRQQTRVWKGKKNRSDSATARQIREYRDKFPDKAIVCDYDGLDGWIALAAGASAPPIRASVNPQLLAALPKMRPYEPTSPKLASDQYALAETGQNYFVCSLREPTVKLELPAGAKYAVRWIDRGGEMTEAESVEGGTVQTFTPPSQAGRVLWVSRK